MIKYIIFDWGGVCTHAHAIKDFAKNLSEKTGKDRDEIEKVFRTLEFPYETGQISPEQFWSDTKNELHLDLPIKDIQAIFLHPLDMSDKAVLDIILKLKKRYKIILLSNNYEDMFAHIKKIYNLDQYFDLAFSSSEIKFKKPMREAYEYVLKQIGAKPEEVLFIDNKEKNIIGAKELGMEVIHFQDAGQLEHDLTKYEK